VAELKLPQLPDRTPIKVTISISPDLHDALREYALAYMDAYGREEPVAELIPAMVSHFLESDRGFRRRRAPLAKT
jgi:hypothetical protein